MKEPSLVVLLLACALAAPRAGAEGQPDGVALIDSCGTYVRMREGSETYQPSQLERTRLCADLVWDLTQALKKRVAQPGERTRRRDEPLLCEIDPAPVGPNQAIRVTYKHLADHPERLHLPARELAQEALLLAFGCTPAPSE